jgi:uncharacterized protein YukE
VIPGGGSGGLGPGPVIVTPDPGLLAADPGVMTAAASSFGSAAHQVYSVATATSDAAGKLAAGWTGKGVQGFKDAASDTNWYSSSAADGLIGASMALSALARSIAAAQALARAAITLADQTTAASAALDGAYASSQASAVAALPSSASAAQIEQAMAPTAGQLADASTLSADATRAVTMMNEANSQARAAWRAAASAFDAVTSQSPSVQLAAISVRVKDFSSGIDSMGVDAILLMTAGMASGAVPGGDDEEEDVSPEFLEAAQSDPEFAADLAGEEKMSVDGANMDPAIAADIEGGVAIGWSDNVTIMQAYEELALDPATADLMSGADPLAGMTPAEYQARFWDPTVATGYGKGSWIYPPDDGADLSAPVVPKSFAPGDVIDRFGPESGNFVSPEGTPWAERSLPATSLVQSGGGSAYHAYEVTSKWATDPPPVEVTQSKVAPAFGQPGGGIQYQFEAAPGSGVKMSVGWLLDHGYLVEVP